MTKVLVADPIAKEGIDRLRREVEVDVATGLSAPQLIERIGVYEGLIVRSETRVTADVIAAGKSLKVIGRAGVGVDNIDVEAATERGILVVNSPGGNTIAAAEHTIAMLLALSRNIAQANASLRSGRWERAGFIGVEVLNKTIGIIGLGRIGSEVARRAQGLMMKVVAYDPFLSADVAAKQGIEMLSLDELLARADYVTLHVPLTADTHHLIGARELALMKPGARLINVARGGIVDEGALCEALARGHLAGAALDVFETEPLSPDSPLLSLPNVVVTPHLGASTREAQVNVAIEVAEEMLLALRGEPVRNAVNLPSVAAEVLRQMTPHLVLVEKMGRLLGYLVDGAVAQLEVCYCGEVAAMNTALLTLAALKGLLTPQLSEQVNLVNAQAIAKRRGIKVYEERTNWAEGFASLITLRIAAHRLESPVTTARGVRSGMLTDAASAKSSRSIAVSGTLFGAEPRIVSIDGYRVDFEPFGYMLIDSHIDKPGMIGKIGTILGNRNINIAGMQVGRISRAGDAITVLSIDDPVPPDVLEQIRQVDGIRELKFVDLGGKP